jgi:hypothetical protein
VEIEKSNRERAAALQKQVAQLVESVTMRSAGFSAEVNSRVQQTGMGGLAELKLAAYPGRIASGNADAEMLPALRVAAQTLATTVQALRDLLEERVRIEPPVIVKEPPRMTLEQFNQLTGRENLARLLKDEASLPPEVRARMIRALEKDFPPKYRQLLEAYYGSFLTPKKEKE